MTEDERKGMLAELTILVANPEDLDSHKIVNLICALRGMPVLGILEYAKDEFVDLLNELICMSDQEWKEAFGQDAFEVAIALQAAVIEFPNWFWLEPARQDSGDWALNTIRAAHRRVRRIDPS